MICRRTGPLLASRPAVNAGLARCMHAVGALKRIALTVRLLSASAGRLALAVAVTLSPALAASAEDEPKTESSEKAPAGLMLIPLTPKIDTGDGQTSSAAQSSPEEDTSASNKQAAPSQASSEAIKPAPDVISPEQGASDETALEPIDENTTLKGTIQLVADDTEYDQEKNTFLGSGNAVAIIGGQNAKLEADTILYDQNNQVIDARGNVRIIRDGQLTTGSAFKFKVTSDEYLITNPDTEIQGATVIARKGWGGRSGLTFKDGTFQMPRALHLGRNVQFAPLSALEDVGERTLHPEAYLPSKPSYKFKARKMVFERYKDEGNLTVFGGKIMFGHFGIPVPKFVTTVGQTDHRVVMPYMPFVGSSFQYGARSYGVNFNYSVGRTGVFTVTPLFQGKAQGAAEDARSWGVGARLAYNSARVTSDIMYGSSSDLVVARYKYRISKTLLFQSGINRFLEDGIFGPRRARMLAEIVHTKGVGGIPLLAGVTFRTSAGWASDNPALLDLTPSYAKLFDTTGAKKLSAYRVQHQIMGITEPIISVGDTDVGAKFSVFGGAGLKGYSTGDALALGQVGPMLDVRLSKARMQTGYTQSAIRGKSPFVFDQFIQGTRSVFFNGDIKLNKFLTIGAQTGYNLNDRLLYQRSITAAIGPEDFKVLLSHDTIRGINRYGFDVLFGQPIPFNKLVLKGSPDAGQLGGI